MSAVSRALLRLASPGAVLAPVRAGEGFGVFPKGDRRCRPVARLARGEVRALSADGALQELEPGVFALSDAGDARVRREAAERGEEFLAQHAPVVTRNVVDRDGDLRNVRGLETHAVLRRLAALQDQSGAHWLSGAELDVAARLRSDWELSQVGLVRGSDWAAPPQSGGARGPGNAVENAMIRHADARKRVAEALEALAPPLRRVVERVCLHEDGLEALERAEGWPARSGKLALKMALAQLAAR